MTKQQDFRVWETDSGRTLPCGLLGRKLGHSYSPKIHGLMADYAYHLFEKEPDELKAFIQTGDWKGLNVTIPYKKDVLAYCSRLSEAANAIGSVNTLVRMPDGGIYGDNTDAYGFGHLLDHNRIDPKGKKVLILGNGGACASVQYVLEQRGARVVVISRKGPDHYENLDRHKDAALIVNTTPLGMYPENGRQAVDLMCFPAAEAVLDLIYNPARTAIMMQAERLGIRTDNGLYMLVAQAYASSIQFQRPSGNTAEAASSKEPAAEIIEKIYDQLSFEMQNIILIGMPGCGKSEVAKYLAKLTDREVLDLDEVFAETFSITPAECILQKGEEVFRKMESEIIADAGKRSGIIISTGGGCVTIPDNYPVLHQNGTIVWLRRDLNLLAKEGRPLSQQKGTESLYRLREPLYHAFSDIVIENDTTIEDAARRILQACS